MARVTWNPDGFRELEEQAVRATAKVAGRARDNAKKIIRDEGRVDTGALMQSIEVLEVKRTSQEVVFEVGSRLEYAIYQHEGVQGPIYPRKAKVLRFKPKGGSSYVFATKVSGFRGIHFLTRALDGLSSNDAR